jgi:O-antigen/teichoic acid export membrane protein
MLLRKLILQNLVWRGLYFFSLFLLNIIVSRYFRADGSGEIYYAMNNLSFLLLIIGLSLESGAAFYISKKEISEQKTALYCLCWALAGTLISMFFFKWMIPGNLHLLLTGPTFFLGCSSYVFGVLLTTYFTPLFFAKGDFIFPNLVLFILTLLLACLLVAFGRVPFIHRHFVPIYFGSFLFQGFVLAWTYFYKNGTRKDTGLLSKQELSKLLRYSLLALSGNIIFFLVYRVDYWFVMKNCSIMELGNYIQVSKLGQIFILLPTTMASAVFIHTASKKEPGTESLKLISRWVTFFYTIAICAIILLGSRLFPFLYGPSFNLMYKPFLLLSPGIISISTLTLLTSYYAGRGMVLINVKGAFYALLIILTGNFFFTPKYGIYAAALTSSLGYIFYQVYVMSVFKKEYKDTRLSDFFVPMRKDLQFFKRKTIPYE